MSGHKPRAEGEEDTEVVEYMEAEEVEEQAASDVSKEMNESMLPGGSGLNEDDAGKAYTNLPKYGEAEPNWSAKSSSQLRDWLKSHNVKGTWTRKLLQTCKDVWDDMMVIARERERLAAQQGGGAIGSPQQMEEAAPAAQNASEEEPDFNSWTPERKRNFLRRRDVKGVWEKYLGEKCLEIWRLEKAGEKYVHTPASITSRKRFPGSPSSVNVSPMAARSPMQMHHHHMTMQPPQIMGTPELVPLALSASDFHELAGAAQKSDLRRVTDLLNMWSAKNQLPEEVPGAHMDDSSMELGAVDGPSDFRWITTEISPAGMVRLHKGKRPSEEGGASAAKRKRLSNGQVAYVNEHSDIIDNSYEAPVDVQSLHARIRDLEAANANLMNELAQLKKKPSSPQ